MQYQALDNRVPAIRQQQLRQQQQLPCAGMLCMFRTASAAHYSCFLGQRSRALDAEASRTTPCTLKWGFLAAVQRESVTRPRILEMLFLGQKTKLTGDTYSESYPHAGGSLSRTHNVQRAQCCCCCNVVRVTPAQSTLSVRCQT